VVDAIVIVSDGPLPIVVLPWNVTSSVNVVPPTVLTLPTMSTSPGNVVVTPILPIVISSAVDAPMDSGPAAEASMPEPTRRESAEGIC
jgi:hypothetical protein